MIEIFVNGLGFSIIATTPLFILFFSSLMQVISFLARHIDLSCDHWLAYESHFMQLPLLK